MKRNTYFNLQLFADGSEAGASNGGADNAGNGANGDASNKNTGGNGNNNNGGSYSFEQAEQIANARAEHASRAALAKYFEGQGMTQDEVTAAINDFKAKKAAAAPNVAAITKERDEALAKVAEMEHTALLRDKGVKADDLDYVLFKVNALVDDKTDFKKAADAFLKDNPRFAGQNYKVSTGVKDGGTGTSQNINDQINNSIRGAFGR